VTPGDKHDVAHVTSSLWTLLDDLGLHRQPSLLRADKALNAIR